MTEVEVKERKWKEGEGGRREGKGGRRMEGERRKEEGGRVRRNREGGMDVEGDGI